MELRIEEFCLKAGRCTYQFHKNVSFQSFTTPVLYLFGSMERAKIDTCILFLFTFDYNMNVMNISLELCTMLEILILTELKR